MTLFTFGQVSSQYLYPLLLSLSCYSDYFSSLKYIKQVGSDDIFIYVICLLDVLSLLFCGILALLSYFCIRKKKYKCSAIFKQNKCSTILLHFFGYSIIILSTYVTYFIAYHNFSSAVVGLEIIKSIQILFCILICYLFLKIKNYKHHYLSIIMCFLASTGIFIIKFIFLKNNKDNVIISMLLIFPHYFSYTIMEAYEKYIMQDLYFPPYLVLFLKGCIGLILGVISIIKFKSDLKAKFNSNSINLSFYLLFIISFFLNIFRILTIHFYNPIYRYVADILVLLFLFIENLQMNIQNESIFIIIIYGILLLIILFSILVYQEIIIINVWGLDKNTSKQIIKRATTDFNNDALNINKSLESIQSINEEDLVPERE